MFRIILSIILLCCVSYGSGELCANLSNCQSPTTCCCDGGIILPSCKCCSYTAFCSDGNCIPVTPTRTPSISISSTQTPTPTPSLSVGASASNTPTFSTTPTTTSTTTPSTSPTQTSSNSQTNTNTNTPTKKPKITNGSSEPTPSATPKPTPSVLLSQPPSGCHAHPFLQTVGCINGTHEGDPQILIVKPPQNEVDYTLPVTDPVLVNGSITLLPQGEIRLLYATSFLCTQGNLTLNGTVSIDIDRNLKYNKNITLINCVNQNKSNLIIGSEFNVKPRYFHKKDECRDYQIKVLNFTVNHTIYVSIDKFTNADCLETKYIAIIVSLVAWCCISLVCFIGIIIFTVLLLQCIKYKLNYEDAIEGFGILAAMFDTYQQSSPETVSEENV